MHKTAMETHVCIPHYPYVSKYMYKRERERERERERDIILYDNINYIVYLMGFLVFDIIIFFNLFFQIMKMLKNEKI